MISTTFMDLNGKRVALRKHTLGNYAKYKDLIGTLQIIVDYHGEMFVFFNECDKITRIKRENFALWEVLRILED